MLNNQLFLFLIISFIIAGAGAWFHYFYKKTYKKVDVLLAFLRFSTIFTLLMLVFNPKIETIAFHTEKPVLAVLVDNSSSVIKQQSTIEAFVRKLKTNEDIQDKFDTSYFKFSKEFMELDSLSFLEKETNIYTSLATVQEVYKNMPTAVLLISDGNQTIGNSVDFLSLNNPVYSVVTGDTIQYNDVSIHKLNVNKYSYLNNNFPVEAFVYYSGEDGLKTSISVYNNKKLEYRENVQFKPGEHSKSILFKLSSKTIGKQFYTLRIKGTTKEINTKNNQQSFAVDVIDEQSNIAIIAGAMHPDVGMLKRSIESNKQRKVSLVKIDKLPDNLEGYDLLILYQPTKAFKAVFDKINTTKLNYFIITGQATDWQFLNSHQSFFKKNLSGVKEAYLPVFNSDYSVFMTEDLGFSSLPPLEDSFGKIEISTSFKSLLYQQIGAVSTKDPLLFTFVPSEGQKAGVLLGDGSWKWRSFHYQIEQSFLQFDAFMSNIIQYLSSNSAKTRLSINAKSFYNENERIEIAAILTDQNYKFDPTATLWLSIKSVDGTYQKNVPFAVQSNAYNVVLDDVPIGTYNYAVKVDEQVLKKYGRFKVKDFDPEQVFDTSNADLMKGIANRSKGKFYTLENTAYVLKDLIANETLKPIQKAVSTRNSLIQQQWLLGWLIVLLSVEWLIRKYHGAV